MKQPKHYEAMVYYQEGHTVAETAERFGLRKSQVNSFAKHYGISNGRNWNAVKQEANQKRRKEAEQRYEQILDKMGFVYLGGYENKKSSLTMRCRRCGCTFKRSIDYINDERFDCPECREAKDGVALEERRKGREWVKAQRAEEQNRIRERKKQRAEAKTAEALFDIPLDTKKGTKGTHRRRARKFGVPYEYGITLAKLIKRDGLRCAICGGLCNLNDHGWSEYIGATYPSIDHIIPMSKGGGHTWDNVQVAHMICNSLKSDKLEKTE